MKDKLPNRPFSRRKFLAVGGGAVALAAGIKAVGPTETALARSSSAVPVKAAIAPAKPEVNFHLTATDGWVSLPGSLKDKATGNPSKFFPDPLAPSGLNTYVFGFRQVPTGVDPLSLKGQAQISAPLLYVDEGTAVKMTLTNAGLQIRPDLVDSHSIHWHGFRNAIPLFDGVPEMSIAVPIGRNFTYYYEPTDPGTYMYHCHFEDVEHVHMGMTGVIFVRPAQNAGVPAKNIPAGKYAYNDGVLPTDPKSTAYDRDYVLFLSEVWSEAHFNDAHIQPTDWSNFHSDFFLINGRCYPDTVAPGTDPANPGAGDNAGLQYQPISSLVKANAGDKVLMRFVSLGYTQSSMTAPGLDLRVIAKDAVLMKGRDSTPTDYTTNTVYIGPGEATDVIFTAPDHSGNLGTSGKGYDTYLIYNRNFATAASGSAAGYSGQMTEVRIYPNSGSAKLPAQVNPNDAPFSPLDASLNYK